MFIDKAVLVENKNYSEITLCFFCLFLGNSQICLIVTVPTMLDLTRKKQLGNFEIKDGIKVVSASVGEGMNYNAMIYQF